jgi:hypothetical protein
MGILNPSPKLDPAEALLWKARANHVEGPGYALYGMRTAAGGQLIVTDRRIFFQPSRLDRAVAAKRWECPVGDVVSLETVGKDAEIFAEGRASGSGSERGSGSRSSSSTSSKRR